MLHSLGADVNRRTRIGATPLMAAADGGHKSAVVALLRRWRGPEGGPEEGGQAG
jgi:ankyrin repeat protein